MHPSKFGDSYDIVKRTLLEWLSSCGTWTAHPMQFTSPPDREFEKQYCQFLGVDLLKTATPNDLTDRKALVDAASSASDHLFLDPDKGLQTRSKPISKEHITVEELARIAKTPARSDKLILVYDQSFLRVLTDEERRCRTREKLASLRKKDVHAIAYHSHANFVLASADKQVLMKARQLLEDELPPERLLGLQR